MDFKTDLSILIVQSLLRIITSQNYKIIETENYKNQLIFTR